MPPLTATRPADHPPPETPFDRPAASRSDRTTIQLTTQGTAPIRQDQAAPCYPAHCNAHEVPTS